MVTENLKSLPITNRDATPQVKNNSSLDGGSLKSAVGYVEVTTADLASTYRMCQVPSNCRIDQVLLYTDDWGSTGLIDVGIYQTVANGGAVVDADHFASAVDVKTSATGSQGLDITHESGVFNIDDAEKPLWQALGLSADPCIFYDVVITSTEAASQGASVALKVHYVI